jgi:hypothetical protein
VEDTRDFAHVFFDVSLDFFAVDSVRNGRSEVSCARLVAQDRGAGLGTFDVVIAHEVVPEKRPPRGGLIFSLR